MNQERRIIFFDLETQRTFQEVGGRHNISGLGLAAAVTYDSSSGEYHSYNEDEVEELVAELAGADLVVGFNVKNFDYQVLRPYTDYPLHTIPTADMLQDIYRELGFRLSLDSLRSWIASNVRCHINAKDPLARGVQAPKPWG